MGIFYEILLVFHLIAVIIAVGSATIVDYLHLVGLRKKSLEKGLVKIYPHISRMINVSLIVIYITGLSLLVQKTELFLSSFFITKLVLVLIVTVNGIYLQKQVSPYLDKCVLEGTKYCTRSVLNKSVVCGSISIVTWYSIIVISLTKDMGYRLSDFISLYSLALAIAMGSAYLIELKARKWRD